MFAPGDWATHGTSRRSFRTMEAVEFVVPVHTEDLELPNKDGNFYVRTVLDVEHVGKAKLSDLLDGTTSGVLPALEVNEPQS